MILIPLLLSMTALAVPVSATQVIATKQHLVHYGLESEFDVELQLSELNEKAKELVLIPGKYTEFAESGLLAHSHGFTHNKKLSFRGYQIVGRVGKELLIDYALFFFCEPARPGHCEEVDAKLASKDKSLALKERMLNNFVEFSKFNPITSQFKVHTINYWGLEYPLHPKK
jgi:hypothetical protein